GEGLRGDLRRLWAWLLHFFRRPKRTIPMAVAATPAADPQQEILAGVRAVYRAFLIWADEQGMPRYRSETPDEFLRRLAGRFPEVQPESTLLTERYVTARYANDPVAASVVDEVRTA